MRMLEISVPGGTLSLPKIVLGTAFFGTRVEEKMSLALLDAYAEMGGTALDTASVYGDWEDKGTPISEELIGRWLKQSSFGSKMKIITKGAHHRIKTPDISRVNAACIEEDIQKSLKALGVDTIDLYFLHRDNPRVPVSEIMTVLDKYVRAGHIRAIGASNWSLERIKEANAFAGANGLMPFSISEIQWTLADIVPQEDIFNDLPHMTPEEYGKYRREGLPVLAWSPQASGVITRLLEKGEDAIGEAVRKKYLTQLTRQRAENVRRLCEKSGLVPTQAVLGYITSNPHPAAAVIGPSNPAHLEDSMKAADLILSEEDIRRLTENP